MKHTYKLINFLRDKYPSTAAFHCLYKKFAASDVYASTHSYQIVEKLVNKLTFPFSTTPIETIELQR